MVLTHLISTQIPWLHPIGSQPNCMGLTSVISTLFKDSNPSLISTPFSGLNPLVIIDKVWYNVFPSLRAHQELRGAPSPILNRSLPTVGEFVSLNKVK